MNARSFFRAMLLFSIPLALALGALELKMRRILNSYSMKAAVLSEMADSAQVLILGSSHELNGIRAADLGRPSVNLANGGQSLEIDAGLALRAAERMPQLKLVIFGISYFSFISRLSESGESWREGFYEHYLGVHESRAYIRLPQLSDYSVAALYDPAQAIVALRTVFRGSPADRGWLATNDPSGQSLLEDDRAAAARVGMHENLVTNSRQLELDRARRRQAVNIMRDVVRSLEARGVSVAFVSSPLYATYRRHLRSSTLQLNEADLGLVRGERPFFDYTADARFGPSDFANFDHLNPDGAKKFTRVVDQDVVAPLLPRGR